MKNMILTSSLYESIELVKKFLDKNTESKKILFIPTATNVDEYKKYIHLTQKAFEDFGYEVENFDVSIFSEKTAKEKLSEAKIVFISGGNTFYLLQELKRKNLIDFIKNRVNSGMVYIGESAGAIITSKDIEYNDLMDDKTIAKDLKEYSGLNLVDFYIVPHLNEFPFEESSKQTVEKYKNKLNIIAINNSQAIIVKDKKFEIK